MDKRAGKGTKGLGGLVPLVRCTGFRDFLGLIGIGHGKSWER